MSRKSSVGLIVFVSTIMIAFMVAGCATKQAVKEEEAAKPVVEAKKEELKAGPPQEVAKPNEETPKAVPAPPGKPKEEAGVVEEKKPEAVAKTEEPPLDLASLRIQFAFDDYSLSSKAKENLEKMASWMARRSAVKIQIQGHACEIGTNEYNLALGDRRAQNAKKYLEALGVTPGRISTISYGEERPLDPGHTEEARSKNRRDEFVLTK